MYPFSALFFVLPLEQAYGWFTVSQLWLAGVCLYVLARTLGADSTLATQTRRGTGFYKVPRIIE